MTTEWGYPHAFAILAALLFLSTWLADRRAARRRREQRTPASYRERFERRLSLGDRDRDR